MRLRVRARFRGQGDLGFGPKLSCPARAAYPWALFLVLVRQPCWCMALPHPCWQAPGRPQGEAVSSNDLDNLAITSLLAGMVGAIFVLFGMQSDGISFVGMLAGACAVAAGVRVLRGE